MEYYAVAKRNDVILLIRKNFLNLLKSEEKSYKTTQYNTRKNKYQQLKIHITMDTYLCMQRIKNDLEDIQMHNSLQSTLGTELVIRNLFMFLYKVVW